MSEQTPPLHIALLSGSMAGICADLSLYPLDTIKTRLQSSAGFLKAGGFRGIFSGVGAAALGSAPTAGLFFCAYESTKQFGASFGLVGNFREPITHTVAASIGEVTACMVRVPVEVVKQRAQASQHTSANVLKTVLRDEGMRGLYRGYLSTVVREIPFSAIQFPLWEFLKSSWEVRQGGPVDAWQSSLCGAIAGAVAAGLTTPLDVAKTRIMLAERGSVTARGNIPSVLKDIARTSGVRGLFAGLIPRTMWVSIGGAIFLGIYEKAVTIHTDVGDLKIELFCEQAPKASENFLALCASGYYDNSLIHRNIKGFMVQMGDPLGTGKGGTSIWARKFEDEIVDNLKHNVRGVVSMANNGPNTNGSQFFITYSKQPHLDMKYTIIGKVIDGLETLDDLEKLTVNEKTFRPLSDTRLCNITIHANPVADAGL